MPVAKLTFEFLVLNGGEVAQGKGWAEWAEIDQAEGVWTVPATRMKAKCEHRVPLCRWAAAILDETRVLNDGASPPVSSATVGSRWPTVRCGGCSNGARPRRYRMNSGRRSATARPRRPIIPERWSRRRLAHVLHNKFEGAYRRTAVRAAAAHGRLGERLGRWEWSSIDRFDP